MLPATPAAAQPVGDLPSRTFVTPYPRARWRLAAPRELEPVVLWFSQILIRHRDARDEVSFSLSGWASVPAPSTRSRAEALELAERIAAEADRDPSHFAELARQHSEDLPRRAEGGDFGGVSAPQLESWQQVLDALAALRPGRTSRVVETRYGFHVFHRAEPPPEETVSGAHIVIGHEQAPWLAIFARRPVPVRTREEAERLAWEIYERARAAPGRFAELVSQYSEHRDALLGGDFGEWSTREPTPWPQRIRRLRASAVGDVAPPIEGHLGFEIVMRTPPRPRARYAARLLAFPVDLSTDLLKTDGTERAVAFARAGEALIQARLNPGALDAMGASWVQWHEGRGIPELTLSLARLQPGELSPEPVDSEVGVVIAQRLQPQPAAAPPAPRTELPEPERPDLELLIGSDWAPDFVPFLQGVAARAQAELELTEPLAAQLRRVHDVTDRTFPDGDLGARFEAFNDVLAGTKELLGAAAYESYVALLHRIAAEVLLGAPADSPMERGL